MNVLDYIENELLACLCSMLAEEGRPTCVCHHYGGEDPPVGDRCSTNDEGANGQAWIRRVSQSIQANADDLTFGGVPCGNAWQAVIELGIYRCISAVPDDNGAAPPPEDYDADRDLLAADRATLAQVLCCWPLNGPAPDPQVSDVSAGVLAAEIVPTGPSGACAGSILTITVSAPLTIEEPTASLVASVDADPDDATGQTAVVTWRNDPAEQIFVSRPAGGG